MRRMDAAPGAPRDGFTASLGTAPEPAGEPSPAGAAPAAVLRFHRRLPIATDRDRSVIRMPAYEQVANDAVLYAHASRILHHLCDPPSGLVVAITELQRPQALNCLQAALNPLDEAPA